MPINSEESSEYICHISIANRPSTQFLQLVLSSIFHLEDNRGAAGTSWILTNKNLSIFSKNFKGGPFCPDLCPLRPEPAEGPGRVVANRTTSCTAANTGGTLIVPLFPLSFWIPRRHTSSPRRPKNEREQVGYPTPQIDLRQVHLREISCYCASLPLATPKTLFLSYINSLLSAPNISNAHSLLHPLSRCL